MRQVSENDVRDRREMLGRKCKCKDGCRIILTTSGDGNMLYETFVSWSALSRRTNCTRIPRSRQQQSGSRRHRLHTSEKRTPIDNQYAIAISKAYTDGIKEKDLL